jgi:hypothetical protein
MHAAIRCAALALLAFLPTAEAARAVRVYDVTVSETAPAAVPAAAMRIALVRATGRRDAASDPAFGMLVSDAQQYVRLSRPGAAGRTEVTLDGDAIDAAILAAGRALWPVERPLTLVVLEVPQGAAPGEGVQAAIEAAAAERGLPVSIVPAATLNLGSGAMASREMLLPAAQRLGADAVLVGRGDGGSASTWQWSLASPAVAESWSGAPASAVHGAADAFVRTADVSSASTSEGDVLVSVSGIADLAAYAGVSQALAQVAGVRRVALEVAAGTTATFRVTVRGGADVLAASLAGHGRLVPAATPQSGALALSWLP